MNEKQRWAVVVGCWVAAPLCFLIARETEEFSYLLGSLFFVVAGFFVLFGRKRGNGQ